MRGSVALVLPAKCRFWRKYSMNGSRGLLATSTPKTQEENEASKTRIEMADPIVAYSKPPPLPPVIGPLVALLFMESTDEGDNL
ncbi:hypothetical protein PHAVU_002G159300 [Phaseolus vulgaris]|uniref:Uncharacterized protein n=1 Tax=Phaseolus vulgaris TaxID=3885 RepID=V7CJZ3_PHAVU|nr:hypothetical protein PHAVU_002G159300g [Phaseolus vulgaris]ESW30517.1 hypothetical protein PHAVU_002G159300g [Phaseolus vulgaris]